MNDNVKRWRQTGLLEGLTNNNIQNCADSLEGMAKLLIQKSDSIKNKTNKTKLYMEGIAGTILPIVRALYEEKTSSYIEPKKLFNEYIKYLKEIKQTFVNDLISEGAGCDVEAEVVKHFVETYKG